MSVLIAQNIEKAWGGLTMLKDASLRLEWHQRVALVGPNGSGKTTLLRILAGEIEPDRGAVRVARGLRVGYLRQERTVDLTRTVWDEAEAALHDLKRIEERLRTCEAAMASATGEDLDAVMEEYGALRDRFEAMGGHDAARDVRRVLLAMGFSEADFPRSCEELSGGQKTRLALARMLLSGTEILLLDEPTNHLDLQATEWLEAFLASFGGCLVVVSHDRRFLDNVVTSVVELDNARLVSYRGDFSNYWRQREERLLKREEDEQKRAAEIARLEEFWRRNKAGQNRNQAWSRYKAAQRLREEVSEGPSRHRDLHVSLSSAVRSGTEVVVVDKLAKRYGDKTLFHNFSTVVTRGQKIGIVGPNGSGKTTFLRIVLGLEPPTSGYVRLGPSVKAGYFAQEATDLDPDMTVIETLLDVRDLSVGEARSFLARFLFTGDDVFKTVSQLSGGERNRLVLAQLVLSRPNLLVLDEPTNHLDIVARQALTEMLKEYDGTLLMASHDRYLLDEVTERTLEIAGGEARLYDASYSGYRRQRSREEQARQTVNVAATSRASDQPRNSFELARMRRQATKAVGAAEQRVQLAEDWLKRIEECLSAPQPTDDIVKLAQDHEQAQKELASAMQDWEAAVTNAEALGIEM
jgi:ATP-binding cassette subfamily F protein 3